MRTLGMMMTESILNEAKRKDWKMPDGTITFHGDSKTTRDLGLNAGMMDPTVKQLWLKYYKRLNDRYYRIDPSFKRGTYQKADKLFRENYHLIETKGDIEVWQSNKWDSIVVFFNKKDKSWVTNDIWISWYE